MKPVNISLFIKCDEFSAFDAYVIVFNLVIRQRYKRMTQSKTHKTIDWLIQKLKWIKIYWNGMVCEYSLVCKKKAAPKLST